MRRALVCLLPSLALAALSCSDDEATPPKPLPPPVVSIVSVQGVGGPIWKPGAQPCVELGQDADQTVVVTIDMTNSEGVGTFTLRPPGTCGSARQCGTALLRVDPSGDGEALSVSAAQTGIPAKLATLGAGSHTFRVELRDKRDEPVIDKETDAPLFAEITLDVKASGGCGGSSDAGGDAASDAEAGPGDAASDAEAGPDDAASDASDAGDAEPGDASDAGDAGADASPDADAAG